ncbi:SnoaL-like domain-containing protein [Roseivivax sp.]
MTVREIAEELVAGCREGRTRENLDKLYAEDAVSVEAEPMKGMDSAETHGLDGIRGKHDWWDSAMEVLEGHVGGPFMHGGDRFAVHFKMKAKDKASGEVTDMEEVAVYHVSGDKIVREEFFYTMG